MGFAWPGAVSLFTPVKNAKSESNWIWDWFKNGKSPNVHSFIQMRQYLWGPCKKFRLFPPLDPKKIQGGPKAPLFSADFCFFGLFWPIFGRGILIPGPPFSQIQDPPLKDTGKVLTTPFHTILGHHNFAHCMSSYSLFHIKLITVG